MRNSVWKAWTRIRKQTLPDFCSITLTLAGLAIANLTTITAPSAEPATWFTQISNSSFPTDAFGDPVGYRSWGDHDNNGWNDVLLFDGLYRNNGNETFTRIKSELPATANGIWEDWDEDGDLDFLYFMFWRNNGAGAFAAADFDYDGRLGILVNGGFQRNNGDGTFTLTSGELSELPGFELNRCAANRQKAGGDFFPNQAPKCKFCRTSAAARVRRQPRPGTKWARNGQDQAGFGGSKGRSDPEPDAHK